MKRIITGVLALCLAVSLITPALGADTGAVQTVRALGILQGDQNGNTDLSGAVSRAEFAFMLAAASSYKDSVSRQGGGYSLFKDVKSGYWASEAIQLAVREGWMTGYTDGTFRPEKTVTLEEACAALLKLLGYDASSLAGSFPQAQLTKAAALGLRDQVSAARGQGLTRQNCAYLFYNLLTAKTAGGQTYAVTLGYTVTNGQIDYTAVAMDRLSGPYVAGADASLPAASTVYRNGELTEDTALNEYDVYYYNESAGTAWIYTDRASGKIEALSPSVTDPSSVTVSGNTYAIESASAAYQLSAMGGGSTGQVVTLLLGMNGGVVEVLTGEAVDTAYLGVIASTQQVLDGESTARVRTKAEVICTDGVLRSFTVDGGTSSAGRLVSVTVSGGGVTIRGISGRSLSGTVSKDADRLGALALAADIQILDTAADGSYAVVEASRLAGKTVTDKMVRHYTLNKDGAIDRLILDDATGDTWTYGYLTAADDLSQGGTDISMRYTYMVNGEVKTVSSSARYTVQTGGLAIRYNSDGSVKSMKNTTAVKLTSLTATTAGTDNRTYELADGVQVYLRQNGTFYPTTLSGINTEDYTLTGYYDSFGCPGGGQVRVIAAEKK